MNGSGQPPVPSADHVIRSTLSSSSSTIISFENPFEEDIIVNVDLQERPLSKTGISSSFHYKPFADFNLVVFTLKIGITNIFCFGAT